MTQTELRQNLSANIKMHRRRLSLTQEKLAEKSGLSAQTINDIEGCRTWVSDKSLIRIAEVLYTTPSDLLLSKDFARIAEDSPSRADILKLKSQIDTVFAEWIKQDSESE